MAISAQMVKELRERTGAGMMECKKALTETNGDIELAIEHMRKTGIAKAEKKAGRIAAEGALAISVSDDAKIAALVEINCETDFVAMGDEFQNFAKQIAEVVRDQEIADVEALLLADYGNGKTIDETRKELIAKIGENMNVRRFAKINTENGCVGAYVHGTKIGVIVELDNSDTDLAKDIAMQVAAAHPLAINKEHIPQELVDREKRIYSEKAAESGKPDNIIEKMVEGSMRKYFEEVTLLGQKFIKNPDQSIEQLLKEKKANVGSFARFELGEGIEKIETDFVAEVMAQAKGQ